MPPPGRRRGSAGRPGLARPGAAVSPQQQDARRLPPDADLRQRAAADVTAAQNEEEEEESTFLQRVTNVLDENVEDVAAHHRGLEDGTAF